MRKLTEISVVIAALAVIAVPGAVWAAQEGTRSSVTVAVPSMLSITQDVGDFTLKFEDSKAGSVTNGQTVGYVVMANNMTNEFLRGAVSYAISAADGRDSLDGIIIGPNSPAGYRNRGLPENATLEPSIFEFRGGRLISTTRYIMDKPPSSGPAGKILNGIVYVNWGAYAYRDLTPADGGSVILTVTLKDS